MSDALDIRQRTERDPGQAVLWERQAVCRFRDPSTGQHLGTFMGNQQSYWEGTVAEGTLAITASRVLTPLLDIEHGVVLVEGQKLVGVVRSENMTIPPGTRRLDFPGCTIAPGFIDIHIHGALGARGGDGIDGLGRIASYLARKGTTAWLPTIPMDLEAVRCCREAMKQGTDGADILGIHIETAYVATKPGAFWESRRQEFPAVQQPARLSLDDLHSAIEASDDNLVLAGFAPELPGALELIKEASRCGVIPAIAHSFASYEQFMRAVEAGAKHVTHVFQVMGLMHMRQPGVVGGALTCDQVTGELIADGVHNHLTAMEVLLRCKGPEQVALITDMTDLAGLPDGTYETYGRRRVKMGATCREEGSTEAQDYTIAGSVSSLDHNIGVLVNRMRVPLARAIRMATLTPATIIGAQQHKGSLEPGKDADLVIMDKPGHVILSMVKGNITYRAKA